MSGRYCSNDRGRWDEEKERDLERESLEEKEWELERKKSSLYTCFLTISRQIVGMI